MDPNTFTMKTQAALEAARQQAAARDQQAIEPEHVLLALLGDPEGVVFPLLHRLGVQPRTLRDRAAEAADRLPKVYASGGAEQRLSPATVQVLDRAWRESQSMTDEYLSTEHLLLAMLDP